MNGLQDIYCLTLCSLWMVCKTCTVWPCVSISLPVICEYDYLVFSSLGLGLFDDGCPTLQGFDWRWLPDPWCTYGLVQLCIYCIYYSRILLMMITGAIWDWYEFLWRWLSNSNVKPGLQDIECLTFCSLWMVCKTYDVWPCVQYEVFFGPKTRKFHKM